MTAAGDAMRAPGLKEQDAPGRMGCSFTAEVCSVLSKEIWTSGWSCALAEHNFLLVDQLVTCAKIYDEFILRRLFILHIFHSSQAVEGASSIT